jgi:hypothetical protein
VGVVHALGEFLEADGGGAESRGAVAADFGHDLFVDVTGETAKLLFGAFGSFVESLV